MRFLHVSRFITAIAVPLVMFPLIFWMQVRLGYEVALFPLYMLPVAKISWEFGWRGAVIAVVAGTALWLAASLYMGQPFKYEWIRYYNAGVRGFLFTMVSVFLLLFKRVVEQHRRRMEAMRALLNVCHGCGAVQGSDGQWIAFEQLVVHPSRQSCECPTCSKLAQQAAQGDPTPPKPH
jgi:hypothetical protein